MRGFVVGLAAALFASLAEGRVAQAQLQARAPGRGYINLGFQYQSSASFFNGQGVSRDGRTLNQLILSAYGELGIVERWLTVSLAADLVRRNVIPDLGATTGFGDLRMGAWTEWARVGPINLMTGLQVGLPTGDSEPEGGPDELARLTARTLRTGDGEVDIEPSIQLGGVFDSAGYPLRHYFIARSGYWIRSEGFSDGVTYLGELGTQVASPGWDRVWIILRTRGVEAFESAPAGGVSSGVGLGNGVSYTLVGAEAQIRLPWRLSVGFGLDAPVRGRGILDAVAFRTVLGFEF